MNQCLMCFSIEIVGMHRRTPYTIREGERCNFSFVPDGGCKIEDYGWLPLQNKLLYKHGYFHSSEKCQLRAVQQPVL